MSLKYYKYSYLLILEVGSFSQRLSLQINSLYLSASQLIV